MKLDLNLGFTVRDSQRLKRLPLVSQYHALKINLAVFLSKLPVPFARHMEGVHAVGVLILRARANDALWVVVACFPLSDGGGRIFAETVVLGNNHHNIC